jgi:hypothetical protein
LKVSIVAKKPNKIIGIHPVPKEVKFNFIKIIAAFIKIQKQETIV